MIERVRSWAGTVRRKFRAPAVRPLKRWLWVVLPIALLGLDLLVWPLHVAADERAPPVGVMALLRNDWLPLGRFSGRPIRAEVGSIGRPRYLDALATTSPNALVISIFADEDRTTVSGAVATAVLSQLKSRSPTDERALRNLFGNSDGYVPGDVRELSLHIPADKRAGFPFDRLYVAVLKHDTGESQLEEGALEKALAKLMRYASDDAVASLVVPTIGFNPEGDHALELDGFFRTLLGSLAAPEPFPTIYVEIYENWPTYALEQASAGLNAAVETRTQHPAPPRLNRRQPRLLLLFLPLCLLACAFVVELTFKNVVVVSAAYMAAFFGSDEIVSHLTDGLGAPAVDAWRIGVYAFLAALFPLIATLDPKEAFQSAKKVGDGKN